MNVNTIIEGQLIYQNYITTMYKLSL